MSLKDFFTNKNKIEFNIDGFKSKLSESGYNEDQIDDILLELQDVMRNVKEKSEFNLEEFFGMSSSIEGLHSTMPNNRLGHCKSIQNMLRHNPEASNAIKLYASYIAYGNASVSITDYKVIVKENDYEDVIVNKKEMTHFLTKWEDYTKIKRFIFILAKDVVTFGDAFLEKVKDSSGNIVKLNYIPSYTMLVKLNDQGEVVKYYQVTNPNTQNLTLNSVDQIQFNDLIKENKAIEFEPDEIVRFSDSSLPGHNDGPLSNMITLWNFLKILEESLVIYNITRARRFIVYFLDVTGKTRERIRMSVRGFTSRLKSIFRLDTKSGSLYSGKSIIPMSSDLVIPVTKDSKTDVKAISADTSSKGFEDLSIYTNRLVDNLLIGHIFSDSEDVEKRKQIEKAFFRMVRIYQKQFTYTLKDLYMEVLNPKGSRDISVEIVFPSVDGKEEIEIVDMIVRRMMVVNQLMAVLGIVPPISWVTSYVFKDLTQIELQQLTTMLEAEQNAEMNEYPDVFTEKANQGNDKLIILSLLQNLDSNDDSSQSNQMNFELKHKAMIESLDTALRYLEMHK